MNKIAYRKLLKDYLKKGFKFVTFEEFNPKKEKQIILRHDIDFCLEYAMEMAEIEHKLGIKANYFFLPHSLYNWNSLNHGDFMQLGHYTSLHVDYTHPQSDRSVKFTRYFSIHRPDKQDLDTDIEYSTYNKKFFSDIQYTSDSNCKEPKEITDNAQLLIHPIWWMTKKGDKQNKLKQFVKLTKLNTEKFIKDNITF